MDLFSLTSVSPGKPSAARWTNPQLLVTSQQVRENIDEPELVVVDCRSLEGYMEGHIPGAISLGDRCDKLLRDSTSRAFSDPGKYEKIFGEAGIGNDNHVVFYHGNITTLTSATIAFWVMEYMGHDKVHLLNGGLEAWEAAGYKLEKEPTTKKEKKFQARVVHSKIATTDEILTIANGSNKNVQLVDSRSREEFEGRAIKSVRGGHVPNVTMNVPHIDTVVHKKVGEGKMIPTGYLAPDVVAEKFVSLDKEKRAIAHCHTGARSTLTYLEFRLLGFKNPANWDESWMVYGSHPDGFSVADEQYFNFASIGEIEKKMTELKAALKKK